MMNKSHYLLAVSLAFNCAFIGAFVYGWFSNKDKPRTVTQTHEIIWNTEDPEVQVFQLDKNQIEGLQLRRKHFHPKMESLRVDLRKHREKLGFLLSDSLTDTVFIMKQVDSIGTLQTQLEKEVVVQLLNEKDVLDPEQQDLFVDIMLEHLEDDSCCNQNTKIKILKKVVRSKDANHDECIEIIRRKDE